MIERDLSDVRILLVEDDATCQETFTALLKECGATVTCAASAEEALPDFSTSRYDVVITDIKLPGEDGVHILRTVRKHSTDLPVILITGFSSVHSAAEAVKLGASDYIMKPLGTAKDLIDSVWKAASHYKLASQNARLQQELRASEEKYRTLFHSSNDLIFAYQLTDEGPTPSFYDINDLACTLLAYPREELLQVRMPMLLPETHHELFERHIQEVRSAGEASFSTILVAGNDQQIPVDINSRRFTIGDQSFVLSIARNMTIRRRVERQLTEVSERERRRLGHELHDGLCQDLISLELLASVIDDILNKENSAACDDLAVIRELSTRLASDARALTNGLFPVELDRARFSDVLRQLTRNAIRLHKIECSFHTDCDDISPDPSVTLNLYRIAQESISNAIKHAECTQITLNLTQEGKDLLLSISDNGNGLTPLHDEGMGLSIMKYRSEVIGGLFDISRTEKTGTRVQCRCPTHLPQEKELAENLSAP